MTKKDLLDLLLRVQETLDNYTDVNDGADGLPVPNAAMSMLWDVDDAIARLEVELAPDPEDDLE